MVSFAPVGLPSVPPASMNASLPCFILSSILILSISATAEKILINIRHMGFTVPSFINLSILISWIVIWIFLSSKCARSLITSFEDLPNLESSGMVKLVIFPSLRSLSIWLASFRCSRGSIPDFPWSK